MLAVALDVPEPVGADSRSGVNRDAVADPRTRVDRHARIELAALADLDAGANDTVRANHRPVAKPDTVTKHRGRSERHPATELHTRADDRRGANTRRRLRRTLK